MIALLLRLSFVALALAALPPLALAYLLDPRAVRRMLVPLVAASWLHEMRF